MIYHFSSVLSIMLVDRMEESQVGQFMSLPNFFHTHPSIDPPCIAPIHVPHRTRLVPSCWAALFKHSPSPKPNSGQVQCPLCSALYPLLLCHLS